MKTLPIVVLAAAPIALAGALTIAPATSAVACAAAVSPVAATELAKFTSSSLTAGAIDGRRDLNPNGDVGSSRHADFLEFTSAAISGGPQMGRRDGPVVVTVYRSCL